MAPHTPGPWLVTHELRSNDEAVCDLVNNTWVIKDHRLPLGNWTADAHLISAAPDLLSAVHGLLDALPSETSHPAIRRAKAAIKKATGETR